MSVGLPGRRTSAVAVPRVGRRSRELVGGERGFGPGHQPCWRTATPRQRSVARLAGRRLPPSERGPRPPPGLATAHRRSTRRRRPPRVRPGGLATVRAEGGAGWARTSMARGARCGRRDYELTHSAPDSLAFAVASPLGEAACTSFNASEAVPQSVCRSLSHTTRCTTHTMRRISGRYQCAGPSFPSPRPGL